MKRTTIFLPEELHERLRRDAFQANTSLAQLIRVKLQSSFDPPRSRRSSSDPIMKVAGVCRGSVLSTDIDDVVYGD